MYVYLSDIDGRSLHFQYHIYLSINEDAMQCIISFLKCALFLVLLLWSCHCVYNITLVFICACLDISWLEPIPVNAYTRAGGVSLAHSANVRQHNNHDQTKQA